VIHCDHQLILLEAVESGEIKITPKPDDNAFGCASVGNYSLVFKI